MAKLLQSRAAPEAQELKGGGLNHSKQSVSCDSYLLTIDMHHRLDRKTLHLQSQSCTASVRRMNRGRLIHNSTNSLMLIGISKECTETLYIRTMDHTSMVELIERRI